jgi:hypothetical protein
MITPKGLRIGAWCFIAVAVLFATCAIFCDNFVAPLGSEINLIVLAIVLLNLIQATLLFIWAQVLLVEAIKSSEKRPALTKMTNEPKES